MRYQLVRESSSSLRLVRAVSATASRRVSGVRAYSDSSDRRVYTPGYTLYKGKAAVSFKVIRPQWQQQSDGLALARTGAMLLEFASLMGTPDPGSRAGDRRYNWEQKQVETFALSPVELGTLASSDPTANSSERFIHDPNINTSMKSSVVKTLSFSKLGGKEYFLQLSVKEGSSETRIGLPVTPGELYVLKRVFDYAIPRLLGMDEALEQQPPEMRGHDSGYSGNQAMPPASMSELPF